MNCLFLLGIFVFFKGGGFPHSKQEFIPFHVLNVLIFSLLHIFLSTPILLPPPLTPPLFLFFPLRVSSPLPPAGPRAADIRLVVQQPGQSNHFLNGPFSGLVLDGEAGREGSHLYTYGVAILLCIIMLVTLLMFLMVLLCKKVRERGRETKSFFRKGDKRKA